MKIMLTSNSDPSAAESLSVKQLLLDAREGDVSSLGGLLQLYRNYLTILATTQLDNRLRRRMNPSDLVQEAMLAAHRDFCGFRGGSEPEFLAWLRQILINCLRTAVETHVKTKKRDMRREVSIDQINQSMDQSGGAMDRILVDRGASPSEPSQRRERAVVLADQLARLSPQYREVIVFRNLQGLSFIEIAERMNRRPGTVRMLWLRAMDQFRTKLEFSELAEP